MTLPRSTGQRPDIAAQIMAGGHRRAQAIDVDGSVRALFEARVAARPDAIALETDDGRISYDSLNRAANRLARQIVAGGGTAGDRVGILLDTGDMAIASMLAALKSGRTYVPLDPSFPRERLAYMHDHCAPRVILTSGQFVTVARSLGSHGTAVIDVECLEETDDSNLDLDAPSGLPAYILYTSGSTGRPKGVIQTGRNLLHFVKSYTSGLGIQADDRLTLFYTFSFSAALMDIYGGLLTGATVLPHSVKSHGIVGLADWLADRRVTVFHSVPTVFRHLVQTLAADQRLETIRVIDLGGEPVTAADIEAFKRHFAPGTVVVNHLAATEASVISQYFIAHDTAIDGPQVPAGVPADGVSVLVVDDDLVPVPEAETGEIVVQSEFLSPGYWQDADLTARAFVAAPSGGAVRRYRTGDLGRLNARGLLEHLGRKDFRVKVRGLTIEVAEIEAVLAGAPDVQDARVVLRDFGDGDQRLVAFIVGRKGCDPSHRVLRDLAREVLPDYMVPAIFVRLEALPLTVTGKVDHKALASLPLQSPASTIDLGRNSSGTDSLESRLVQIWREVLRVSSVGVDDNFFELGGHSLLAMTMLARVEQEFDCRLAASVMAHSPTLRGLADAIRRGAESTSKIIVPFNTGTTRPPIFCIAPDHALHFRVLAAALGAEQPFYGVQPPHADGFRVPDVTVEHMARFYADRIEREYPSGSLHLVGFCGGGVIAFELAHVLLARGRDLGVLALLDTPRHFDRLREHRIGALRYYARRLTHHPRVALGLPPAGAVRYLVDRLRQFATSAGATPDDTDRVEISPEGERALAENRDAFARYHPRSYPREINLILAGDSFSIFRDDPRLGWTTLAEGGIRLRWVPGGHNSFLREPHVAVLKHHLEGAIYRAQRRS